jgi:hypothetical protein
VEEYAFNDLERRTKMHQQSEDMFVRMLGKRDVILTKYDDPERIAAIAEEWSGMISLLRYGYGWWFDKK